jgi:hypothetical protein
MATPTEAINSIGNALKQAMKRIETLEREVAAIKSRSQSPSSVQVTNFPAPAAVDPLLTTEEDGEFEEVG